MTLACRRRRATLLVGASFALGRKQPWALAVDELSESCALRTLALTDCLPATERHAQRPEREQCERLGGILPRFCRHRTLGPLGIESLTRGHTATLCLVSSHGPHEGHR
jgi:hypothetical protein